MPDAWLIPRSLLFVPGDSERKQAKALASTADALILDLEDSVAAPRLPMAREQVRQLLCSQRDQRRPQLWVRVNSLQSGQLLEDLVALVGARPDGIVLPKISSPQEVVQIGHFLSALEAREGCTLGSTRLLVIATETPRAVLSLHEYSAAIPRLAGLTWGGEDLSATLGASATHTSGDEYGFTYQLARSMCQLAAAASDVPAFDAVQVNFRDLDALARETAHACTEGFAGKLAIHPDQVAVINAAFTPSAEQVASAQRIVAAFAASPESGVLNIDGQMVDRPHLTRAHRVLERASAWATRGP